MAEFKTEKINLQKSSACSALTCYTSLQVVSNYRSASVMTG